ncbi:MAG: hypothetical protein CMJ83_16165 [Planctomycetes bacterium]|nr:hypothetical protein [Planctomycetota bacterium]
MERTSKKTFIHDSDVPSKVCIRSSSAGTIDDCTFVAMSHGRCRLLIPRGPSHGLAIDEIVVVSALGTVPRTASAQARISSLESVDADRTEVTLEFRHVDEASGMPSALRHALNRRDSVRVFPDPDDPVRIGVYRGLLVWQALLSDISCGGVRIHGGSAFGLSLKGADELVLEIALPDGSARIAARVVRRHRSVGEDVEYALEFTEGESDEVRDLVRTYVMARQMEDLRRRVVRTTDPRPPRRPRVGRPKKAPER